LKKGRNRHTVVVDSVFIIFEPLAKMALAPKISIMPTILFLEGKEDSDIWDRPLVKFCACRGVERKFAFCKKLSCLEITGSHVEN
jgi:hypothetical protein